VAGGDAQRDFRHGGLDNRPTALLHNPELENVPCLIEDRAVCEAANHERPFDFDVAISGIQ